MKKEAPKSLKTSDETSTLKDQLSKAWKRIADLETRIHDLTLQLTMVSVGYVGETVLSELHDVTIAIVPEVSIPVKRDWDKITLQNHNTILSITMLVYTVKMLVQWCLFIRSYVMHILAEYKFSGFKMSGDII